MECASIAKSGSTGYLVPEWGHGDGHGARSGDVWALSFPKLTTECPFYGRTQHPGGSAGSRTQTEQDGAVRVKEREGSDKCVRAKHTDLWEHVVRFQSHFVRSIKAADLDLWIRESQLQNPLFI